jgi:hypothetical protein
MEKRATCHYFPITCRVWMLEIEGYREGDAGEMDGQAKTGADV